MERILLQVDQQFNQLMVSYLGRVLTPYLLIYSSCSLSNLKNAPRALWLRLDLHTLWTAPEIFYNKCYAIFEKKVYTLSFITVGNIVLVCFTPKNPDFTDRLPKPEEFSNALYMLDCGQNDLHYGLITTTEEQVKASIPNIISQFAVAIEVLLMLLFTCTVFQSRLYFTSYWSTFIIYNWLIEMIYLWLAEMLVMHLNSKSHVWMTSILPFSFSCLFRSSIKKEQEYFGYIIPDLLAACLFLL